MFIQRHQKPFYARNRFAQDHAPSYRSDRREARVQTLQARARLDRKVVSDAIAEALGDYEETRVVANDPCGFGCPVGGGEVSVPGFTLRYGDNGRLLSATAELAD